MKCAILICLLAAASAETPDVDKNVKLVFAGMRHGNRNPGQFLPSKPPTATYGYEGPSELTKIGKIQAHTVGEMLRDRYGYLFATGFPVNEVKSYSSSANRAQMTLQSALSGLLLPKGKSIWDPDIDWQPAAYTINNQLLRMYDVSECTTSNDAWAPISDDNLPTLVDWLEKDKTVIDYISKNTGWNGSLSNMADVADNLGNLKLQNLPMPDWVANPTLPGYTGDQMLAKIMTFAEAHQIACANYRPCGYTMGGLWANNLIDWLNKAKDNKLGKTKFVVYASHTEITLSTMKLLGMDQNECPTSAGFVLEYREEPEASVRLIFHEPDPNDYTKRLAEVSPLTKGCDGKGDKTDGGWCSLEDFIARVTPNSFSNWREECDAPLCPKKKGPK